MKRKKPTPKRIMRLRQLRRSREMKQSELAELVGLDSSTICLIERGLRQPSFDKAREIAAVFGEPVEIVFDYVEVPA